VRILIRRVLSTTATVVLFLIVTAIGELLPFMRDLDAAINRDRGTLLGLAATALVLGFSGFMGGVIYGAVRSGGSTDPGSTIDGPRQAISRAFHIEVTFREMKDAWREGKWLTDPGWRFVFFITTSVAIMVVGMLGLVFVLGFAGLRLTMAGLFLYILVMVVRGVMVA